MAIDWTDTCNCTILGNSDFEKVYTSNMLEGNKW